MDKVVSTAQHTEPSMASMRKGSSDLVTTSLGPVADVLPQFRRSISSISLFVFTSAFFAAAAAALQLLLVSKLFAVRTIVASKFCAVQAAALTGWLSWIVWNSQSVQQLRRKLVFEFFVLVLGPSGNALFLMIFWPGWLLVVPATWALLSWSV